MKLNRLLSLVAVLVIGFGLYALGADDDHDQPRPPTTQPRWQNREGQGGREGGLHQQMETMGRAFKRLQAQVPDSAKNESSLELLSQLEQATLACKSQIPGKVMRMPATQQSEEKNDYRQMMVNLFRAELDLEEQLINGDNSKAVDTVRQMDQIQHDGHKEFRPQRERRD
jgi:hypothetical protein